MRFVLESIEPKTSSTGKPYAKIVVRDETGVHTASMWEGFEGLVVGANLDGELVVKGSFTNFKLRAEPGRPKFMGGGVKAAEAIAVNVKEAQERTHENVKEAATDKKSAIKLAAAMRDATTIALAASIPFPTDEEFKAEFIRWRDWYLKTWSETEKMLDVPF